MGKYWKSPDEKEWYQVVVDGKLIGIMEDSATTRKELKRIGGGAHGD